MLEKFKPYTPTAHKGSDEYEVLSTLSPVFATPKLLCFTPSGGGLAWAYGLVVTSAWDPALSTDGFSLCLRRCTTFLRFQVVMS